MRLRLMRGLLAIVAAGLLFHQSFGQKAEKETAAQPTLTVLFVCERGSTKSVMAAAYFDRLARERGLKYKAISRGINPDPALSQTAKKFLQEDGIEAGGWKPALVAKKDMDDASRIITLGCTLPGGDRVASKATDWNDIPSPSQNYQLARDMIKNRVRQLVENLAAEEKER